MRDDDDDTMLSAGFAIDTQGAFSELQRFYQFFDSGTVKVLEEMRKVEVATGGMMNLSGPTREVAAFGDAAKHQLTSVRETAESVASGVSGLAASLSTTGSAATREARALANEKRKTATAGEALIRTLEREAMALGQTKDQMRAAKVEAIALAASNQGNTDVADRLLTAARQREFAATAVAEAEDAAAARVAAAAERQAQALRSAAHAHDMFEAKVREGAAAMAVADREAAQFDAVLARVQARVDPAAVAIGRLKTELDEARMAFDRGKIGAEAFEQEQARVAAAAGKVYGPQRQLTDVTRELAQVQRFTASETLNLARQFQDIGVTAAMGMNPLMILVQQGPQIYDVLEQAKMRGVSAGAALAQMGKDVSTYAVTGFARLAPLINPVNLLLTATAVAVVATVRALGSYGSAIERFETTASGLGRTSGQTAEQLEAIAEAASVAGERSIGATRDSVAAFAAAGIQGEQTLTSLAGMVDKYAKLTGQDAPAAQAALAAAMSDPAKAADTFTQSLGLLTGAQYEHIRQLAAQGDQEQATAELTRILSGDIAANAHQVTGLAHVMDMLGNVVASVSTMFGRLDQKIRSAGASYDSWLKQQVGGWAVDLFGTGNKTPLGPNANAGRNQDQVAALNASQSLNTTGMKQYNELLAQQRVLQKGLADTTGLTATQVRALRHDYSAVTDTIKANRTASGDWITTQERSHLVAQAQTRLSAARTKQEKAAAQQQITNLRLGTQVLTQQERQTQAQDAFNKVASRYTKPTTDHHAEQLANQAKAIEAQITNVYKLVDAYGEAGGAALIAEARVKAESDAIKKRGDIEAAVSRQIRLAMAERIKAGAQSAKTMEDEARLQDEVNAAVAAGNVPAALAGELLRDRLAQLPLAEAREAALRKASEAGAKGDVAGQEMFTDAANKASAAIDKQTAARQALTDKQRAGAMGVALVDGERQLTMLAEETRLIGANEAARVQAFAVLKATQDAEAKGWSGAKAKQWIDQQAEIASGQYQVKLSTDALNSSLTYQGELLDEIATNVSNAARGMADAFGEVGRALGDTVSIYASFAAQQERLGTAHEQQLVKLKQNTNVEQRDAAIKRENGLFAQKNATAQIGLYGDMTHAAKGFFKQGSDGYKAMAAAEKVFRAVEFAMSIRSIAQDAIETITSITNSGARAAAAGAEGVANQSKLPFPANIAAMAATAAALIGAGVMVAGGFGGGKNTLPKANEGTGTVLGDSEAKSESIRRAIDGLKEVDTLMLSSSREMAGLLRSIDNQIGGVAALVVRAGDVNASGGVDAGFKTNAVGSVLKAIVPVFGGALASLFGTKTTVVGSGLSGGPQTLDSILNGGFDASYYSDVQKKKKLFGITTSTKYSTQYTGADAGLENQFTLILRNFNSAIAAAAGPLGESTTEIQRRLSGFVVDIGKIDLQGLTGEQIQEKLSAVFGAAADKMALAAFPGFERFQKVGEGAFETLVRVASTVESVSASLDMLGGAARGLGFDAKLGLADQFDSVGDFNTAADAYFQAFYTKEEQAAAKTAQFAKVFGSLGAAMPETLAGFRQLVDAQDLTTAAGQSTYATLLQLAPAFADLKTAMDGAKSSADILAERQDLERKILELNGDTAAIRALDLAKVDVSNRALQQQVWAIQDAQKAADAAKQLSDAWSSVGNSIEDEIKRIRGLSNAAGETGFAAAMGQFNAATNAARGGDMDAAKSLPALSQALLKIAGDNATSRQELDRVQAQTAASLAGTNAAIAAIASGNPLSTTTAQGSGSTPTTKAANDAATLTLVAAVQPAVIPVSPENDMASELRSLRDEVVKLREDNNSGQAAIASSAKATARILDAVTADHSGQAISIGNAA
jgi:hypothetical protein